MMQPQHNHKRPIGGSYLVQQTSLSSSEDEYDGEFDHFSNLIFLSFSSAPIAICLHLKDKTFLMTSKKEKKKNMTFSKETNYDWSNKVYIGTEAA